MLVFEALYINLMVQGLDEDTALTVRVEKTFGETRIKIDFEGEPVSYSIDDLPHNVEGAVMNLDGNCFVITLMIILNYLGQYDYVCVAIYGEVLLGWLINLVNVVGDIVTVATEDENMKKISHKKNC